MASQGSHDNKDYPSVSPFAGGGNLGGCIFIFLEDIWFVIKDAGDKGI